ncbi:uncharacterized protein F5891DRAFT_1056964 [Suillus fuscotomentosus]|uniref:Uncharacterized protein n=1 Tax=Suillus fuscotomentosus TaxID=1912939 RepID=A0AAD4DX62_9AGAM|nr:uncharacterized protein F5891DRAFT_1056964 [Suillus fuscotomentosus]KAG1895793.1 hypothetical protein F5891DRAFT_1056964 [Suillus fuscotomentosus]
MSNSPPPVNNSYDPTNALDDIPGLHWALHEFLQSRMHESERFCEQSDPEKQRLYFATGFGLIQCVKGLMSFEDKDLLAAINHTKRGIAVASAHRKRPASFAGRLAGYIVPAFSTSGTEWIAGMTPVERHAELVYAESLYQKSLLGIVYSGDWLAFIREVLNMRTTISIYRQLGKWIETVDAAYALAHPELLAAISTPETGANVEETPPQSSSTSFASANSSSIADSPAPSPKHTSTQDTASPPSITHLYLPCPSIDPHFRSGVYLGLGMSHLVLSMMPGKLLALVELFGYKGDRKFGLELLERAGGWGANGKVVEKEAEGVRRAICDMSLLIFHLVLSAFTFEGVDVRKATRILEWNLKRYPNGVFFLFGAGRLALVRSQPSKALTYYARAAQAQSQYRNLHHISWWESAVACLGLWRVADSRLWWGKLGGEATWSKATYTYGEAACLATLGKHAEAKKLMERVQGLRQKIAGKSIPIEKFVARKARKYLAQSDTLLLPALELAYVFHAIAHAPREVIAREMIPAVGEALGVLGLVLSSESEGGAKASGAKTGKDKKLESRSGYWDDVCLARFLEGVCWRFVAYPDPDAELEPDEKIPVSPEDARTYSERAFRAVFEHGPDIELDHYIVYYAHFEYGRLLARSGDKDGARTHFNLVLSGKPLEVNAAGRKGKYSLENALHVRTNAALEALDQNRLL